MKTIKQISVLAIMLLCITATAQRNKELEKKIIERKIDTTYSTDEAANMYFQFYQSMQKMNLSDEIENEYTNILFSSVAKMGRLDDKDKNYTEAERKVKFLKMVDTMNTDIKAILTEEQYKLHKENFNRVLKSVFRRSNWEWKD